MRTHARHILILLLVLAAATPAVTYAFDIGVFVLSTVSLLTNIAGNLLDSAVNIGVRGMGWHIQYGGLGTNLALVWTIVRDIVNLTFVFGLIYAGIMTIFRSDNAQTKKLIASIIMGAILVNFSLFFSKVVIDVSNVAANEIYQQMNLTGNISDTFMVRMGISKIIAVDNPDAKKEITKADGAESTIAFAFVGSIFLLVAAFVFAAGALLLIIRFGVLLVLMAISPVAFVSSVLPRIGGWHTRWWSALFSQAFFAPAYFFMIYVVLKLTEGSTFTTNTSTFDQIFTAQGLENGTNTIVFYGILIVGMVLALIIAKQMGAYGAATAVNWGNSARRYGQRVVGGGTFGLAARLGRNTAGQWGTRTAENEKLLEQASRKGIGGWAARQGLKTFRGLSSASFDARRVGGVGKALNIGEGQKGGYKAAEEAVKKRELEFAKGLGEVRKGDTELDKVVETRKEIEKGLKEIKIKQAGATNSGEKSDLQRQRLHLEEKLSETKEKENAEKQRRQFEYGRTVESHGEGFGGFFYSLGQLRTRGQNKEAGSAIRKRYEKESKKGDSDKANDRIIETLEKNAAKDKE